MPTDGAVCFWNAALPSHCRTQVIKTRPNGRERKETGVVIAEESTDRQHRRKRCITPIVGLVEITQVLYRPGPAAAIAGIDDNCPAVGLGGRVYQWQKTKIEVRYDTNRPGGDRRLPGRSWRYGT